MTALAKDVSVADSELIVRREGHAGIIVLNRPKAINALTLGMTRGIAQALDDFERDPGIAVVILEGAGERGLCAGGDIRGLYDSAKAGGDLGPVFWREEYIINARIAAFPKPYVAYMDGLVMGGGVGLAAHAAHRVVTEKTRIAMPEVGIGFFPDVGGTWLLSRAPGEVGTYFGLTAQIMNAADAIGAGFADMAIVSGDWPALREALCRVSAPANAADARKLMARFAAEPSTPPIATHRASIDSAFKFDKVEDIAAALERDGSGFSSATLSALSDKSPTSLKVTLKLLRLARVSKSLKECLAREYIAAQEVFVSHDFIEGVRAVIIDKDRNPAWKPARLEDVSQAIVAKYFAPHAQALTFPN